MNQPFDSESEPQRLGDFEILGELGRGGMGIVYEARQRSLRRRVALKVLSSGLGLTAKAVIRFRREAEAAAKLHHTNIVPIYATGEEDGTHYYAMELIEGPSLDRVIRQMRAGQPPAPSRGSLDTTDDSPDGEELADWVGDTIGFQKSPAAADSSVKQDTVVSDSSSGFSSGTGYFDTVARMMAEVANALEYAHKNGVVHRDIKPSNLLLSPDGRLSVNDFGLARMLEQPGMTVSGEFVGSPLYMSPEQITAGRVPLDHRTDIYSLGATLYELLTLRPPFSGRQRDLILSQIIHKEPPPPRKLNKNVPVDLQTICLKALEKDPDRRYPTAGELADDLRRYVNRHVILARRVGPVGQMIKWARRHRGWAATLVCAVLLAGIAALFASWAYVEQERRIAEQKQHERDLLAEKQQRAIENALQYAMSGQFKKAEEAMDSAELLGAPPRWVHMIRGQVAFHDGKTIEAIERLEHAVRLDPQSVAARSMLAMAYMWGGRWNDYERTLAELYEASPGTPEDYVFKGQALALYDSEAAVEMLNEAVRRLPSSGIARIIRAEARVVLAIDTGNPKFADDALDDVRLAKELLGDNAAALGRSVHVHVAAASVYKGANGNTEKILEYLDQAKRDAVSLERFPTLLSAQVARAQYFEYVNDYDAAAEAWSRVLSHGNVGYWGSHYAAAMVRRGKSREALEALEKIEPPHGALLEVALAYLYVLVDHTDGKNRALAAYEELETRDILGRARILAQTIPLLLGRKDEVLRASKERQPVPLPSRLEADFQHGCWQYLVGDASGDELLEGAGSFKYHECIAHYIIAMKMLADGRRGVAREHFEQAEKTGVFRASYYRWSRAFLARIESDPNWPPWIEP